jgi:hypothetical protein
MLQIPIVQNHSLHMGYHKADYMAMAMPPTASGKLGHLVLAHHTSAHRPYLHICELGGISN